jgi:hypothetical protein
MRRTDDSTAHAANWRTVLAVDAGLGVLVVVVGVALLLLATAVVGAALVVLGTAYAALVGARARRWSRLRGGLQGDGRVEVRGPADPEERGPGERRSASR